MVVSRLPSLVVVMRLPSERASLLVRPEMGAVTLVHSRLSEASRTLPRAVSTAAVAESRVVLASS